MDKKVSWTSRNEDESQMKKCLILHKTDFNQTKIILKKFLHKISSKDLSLYYEQCSLNVHILCCKVNISSLKQVYTFVFFLYIYSLVKLNSKEFL